MTDNKKAPPVYSNANSLFLGKYDASFGGVKHTKAINQLRQIGLSSYESRVYLSLRANRKDKWLKATLVATNSKVPQAKIYTVLYGLERKGLVQTALASGGDKQKWNTKSDIKKVRKLKKEAKKYGFRLKWVSPRNHKERNNRISRNRSLVKIFRAKPINIFLKGKIKQLERLQKLIERIEG